jgi:hypothetical protein
LLTGRSLDICPCCGGRMVEIAILARIIAGLVWQLMTIRSSSDHAVTSCAATSAAQGRSQSLPHPSSVGRRLKPNMARQSVSLSMCFGAVTGAAIAVQQLDAERTMAVAADRGFSAAVQRP